jgi:tRNA threonylcarbamoyladenosine biosynthesis protein TsaB
VLVVVVDTSTPAVTAALVRVDQTGVDVLAERVTVDGRAHGERLTPAIDEVIRQRMVAVGDLGAVVAGLGPGPFTGLRVGLVTAAAIGQALAIPVYGVCSLDAIGAAMSTGATTVVTARATAEATAAPTAAPTTLVATDARRREVYWALYRSGQRVAGPGVHRPDAVLGALAELGHQEPTGAVGDGALRYAEVLGLSILDGPRYPPARELACLAAERVLSEAPSETLTPLYLRRPDAVEPAPRTTMSSVGP